MTRGRKGARQARRRVDRGEMSVGGHDPGNACTHCGSKWHELDGLQPFALVRDRRQEEVGIDAGVALSRKVLAYRHDPG